MLYLIHEPTGGGNKRVSGEDHDGIKNEFARRQENEVLANFFDQLKRVASKSSVTSPGVVSNENEKRPNIFETENEERLRIYNPENERRPSIYTSDIEKPCQIENSENEKQSKNSNLQNEVKPRVYNPENEEQTRIIIPEGERIVISDDELSIIVEETESNELLMMPEDYSDYGNQAVRGLRASPDGEENTVTSNAIRLTKITHNDNQESSYGTLTEVTSDDKFLSDNQPEIRSAKGSLFLEENSKTDLKESQETLAQLTELTENSVSVTSALPESSDILKDNTSVNYTLASTENNARQRETVRNEKIEFQERINDSLKLLEPKNQTDSDVKSSPSTSSREDSIDQGITTKYGPLSHQNASLSSLENDIIESSIKSPISLSDYKSEDNDDDESDHISKSEHFTISTANEISNRLTSATTSPRLVLNGSNKRSSLQGSEIGLIPSRNNVSSKPGSVNSSPRLLSNRSSKNDSLQDSGSEGSSHYREKGVKSFSSSWKTGSANSSPRLLSDSKRNSLHDVDSLTESPRVSRGSSKRNSLKDADSLKGSSHNSTPLLSARSDSLSTDHFLNINTANTAATASPIDNISKTRSPNLPYNITYGSYDNSTNNEKSSSGPVEYANKDGYAVLDLIGGEDYSVCSSVAPDLSKGNTDDIRNSLLKGLSRNTSFDQSDSVSKISFDKSSKQSQSPPRCDSIKSGYPKHASTGQSPRLDSIKSDQSGSKKSHPASIEQQSPRRDSVVSNKSTSNGNLDSLEKLSSNRGSLEHSPRHDSIKSNKSESKKSRQPSSKHSLKSSTSEFLSLLDSSSSHPPSKHSSNKGSEKPSSIQHNRKGSHIRESPFSPEHNSQATDVDIYSLPNSNQSTPRDNLQSHHLAESEKLSSQKESLSSNTTAYKKVNSSKSTPREELISTKSATLEEVNMTNSARPPLQGSLRRKISDELKAKLASRNNNKQHSSSHYSPDISQRTESDMNSLPNDVSSLPNSKTISPRLHHSSSNDDDNDENSEIKSTQSNRKKSLTESTSSQKSSLLFSSKSHHLAQLPAAVNVVTAQVTTAKLTDLHAQDPSNHQRRFSSEISSISSQDGDDDEVDDDSIESEFALSSMKLSTGKDFSSTINTHSLDASPPLIPEVVDEQSDGVPSKEAKPLNISETQPQMQKEERRHGLEKSVNSTNPLSRQSSKNDSQQSNNTPSHINRNSAPSSTKTARRSLQFQTGSISNNGNEQEESSEKSEPIKITKPIKDLYSLAGYDISLSSDNHNSGDDNEDDDEAQFDVTPMVTLTLNETDLGITESKLNIIANEGKFDKK